MRQATRTLKQNVFYTLTLSVVFMVIFVLTSLAYDPLLTQGISSELGSNVLLGIGGMQAVFQFFLLALFIINTLFLSYLFRLRIRRNTKTFALYRLLGMRNYHLFLVYVIEVAVFLIVSVVLGGVLGALFVRKGKILIMALGTLRGVKVSFTFSLTSFFIAILLYAISLFISLIASFFIVMKTDIIVLFKQEQLSQKISKWSFLYGGIGLFLTALVPVFSKLGDTPQQFLVNMMIVSIVGVVGMYFLYKSIVTIIFALRRYFGLHKRCASEFITGQFFYAQLNKSALMMTVISVFLITIYLFSFLNQMISPAVLNEQYGNDFSMLNATSKDKDVVVRWLKQKKIKAEYTDIHYTHIVYDTAQNRMLKKAEIDQLLLESRTNNTTYEKIVNNVYQSYFFIAEKDYKKNVTQIQKGGQSIPFPIESLYDKQKDLTVKQIEGNPMTEEALSQLTRLGIPGFEKVYERYHHASDISGLQEKRLTTYFFDRPTFGAGPKLGEVPSTRTFVMSDTVYHTIQKHGREYTQTVFNAPHMSLGEYRHLHDETPLKKYSGISTRGKFTAEMVVSEIQAPAIASVIIVIGQIMLYIIVLILYRLSDILENQYRIFKTLHIVGATNGTIIGSIFFQVFVTLSLPMVVSFGITWLAVSTLLSEVMPIDEIWRMMTPGMPYILAFFILKVVCFTAYQSFVVIQKQ